MHRSLINLIKDKFVLICFIFALILMQFVDVDLDMNLDILQYITNTVECFDVISTSSSNMAVAGFAAQRPSKLNAVICDLYTGNI